MVEFIYNQFYGISLHKIIGYMLFFVWFWKLVGQYLEGKINKRKFWKMLNVLIAVNMMGIIILVTLVSRNGGNNELILIPFHSFKEAKLQPEMYRSMLMNVFLFFPLGLSLPFSLSEKWKLKVVFTILVAFMLSVAIEYIQYRYCLGRAETDDVICNTLGCAIGTLSYSLSEFMKRKKHNECKKEITNERT